jgi:hypothetical protein
MIAVLAHGVGGRSDLPVPVWLFAYGAGMAVLLSFLMLVQRSYSTSGQHSR